MGALDFAEAAGRFMTHCVDEHWEIMERARATRDDPVARAQLRDWVEAEFKSVLNPRPRPR
jgi:hypothetical protein